MNRVTVVISQERQKKQIVTKLPIDYKFTPLEQRLVDKMTVCKDDLLQLVWEKVNSWFYLGNFVFYLKAVVVGIVRFSMSLNGRFVDVTTPLDKVLIVSDEIFRALENKLAPVLLYMRTNQTASLPGSKYKCHKTVVETLKQLQYRIDFINGNVQPKQLFGK
jgi:hypothetical protein